MFLCILLSAIQMLDKSACLAFVSSAVFADLVGSILGELLLLDPSPCFHSIISSVPSLSSDFSAIML